VITDVAGVLVGRHGTTVAVLLPDGTTGAVDQRGGAAGSRETNLLDPENLVQRVDAVCLSGGGAYGLAAADGVVRWLSERGRGFPVGAQPHEVVPIVPAATVPAATVPAATVPAATVPAEGRPDASAGYAACEAAGALGTEGASEVVDDFVIGALAVVHERGIVGVVAVDAALSKAECRRLAVSAHDGIVRAVRTRLDGTTIFVVATGERALPAAEGRKGDAVRAAGLDVLCAASARVFERAVK
jgi:L-aminopeptidase/D-esterase-like protein